MKHAGSSSRRAAFGREIQDARKRVPKACDRCRLRKVKCDGTRPCTRCKNEDAVCYFGARKKVAERHIPLGYVDQLEHQQRILVRALRQVWTRFALPVLEDQPALGDTSIHYIIEQLGGVSDMQSPCSSPVNLDFDTVMNDGDEYVDGDDDLDSLARGELAATSSMGSLRQESPEKIALQSSSLSFRKTDSFDSVEPDPAAVHTLPGLEELRDDLPASPTRLSPPLAQAPEWSSEYVDFSNLSADADAKASQIRLRAPSLSSAARFKSASMPRINSSIQGSSSSEPSIGTRSKSLPEPHLGRRSTPRAEPDSKRQKGRPPFSMHDLDLDWATWLHDE